jgi:hypothetical protein
MSKRTAAGVTGDNFADVGCYLCMDDTAVKSLLKGMMGCLGYDKIQLLIEEAVIELKLENQEYDQMMQRE